MKRALALALALSALAPAGAAARCPEELPVRAQPVTANAAALQRIGTIRVTPGPGVSDLRVRLRRGGRLVADGARPGTAAGPVLVRLQLRGALRAGAAELVVAGRVRGCGLMLSRRAALRLDARVLPVRLVASDASSVTLAATGDRVLTDLTARRLDADGATLATATRRSLRTLARLEFARAPSPGRSWLLVRARVRGRAGTHTYLAAVDTPSRPAPAPAAAPVPAPALVPPPGAVVQTASVSWSGGRWEGHETGTFTLPGIGDGQVVCRPDTQWLRVFPADRSRDVAMLLWTFRDWEGGSEYAIREAGMTPFTGPDFNEGMNKFTPPEKRSHGSFAGIVGDGLPAPGSFGRGRAPIEVRVAWSWDFSDPANARCAITATVTSEGPGSAGTVARGLSLAWSGVHAPPPDASLATHVPGLGTVRLRCEPTAGGERSLSIEPEAGLAALDVTTYQASDRSVRRVPLAVDLPANGLVEATGAGGVRLLLASRWKLDDVDPASSFCRITGLAAIG